MTKTFEQIKKEAQVMLPEARDKMVEITYRGIGSKVDVINYLMGLDISIEAKLHLGMTHAQAVGMTIGGND